VSCRSIVFFAVASSLVSSAAAQSTLVLPRVAVVLDGNWQCNWPFVSRADTARMQQIIDGKQVATTSARITELAYRRDATNRKSYSAAVVSILVQMGHGANSAATMSTTFASNRAGAMTTVFSGTYHLPAQPPVSGGVAPFQLSFKLVKPFFYQRASGSLLIEVSMTNAILEYDVDAHRGGADGFSQSFGSSGSMRGNTSHLFRAAHPEQIKPGGTLTLEIDNLRFAAPALLLLGTSNDRIGPLPLPLDLAALGAPSNFLYVSPDSSAPVAISANRGVWGATLITSIPNIATLAGRTLFSQPLYLDAQSNALGIVTGNAISFTFGGKAASMNTVGSRTTNSAAGAFVFGTNGQGGPVTQLRGSFN